MSTFWIVVITLFAYWTLGWIIYFLTDQNETFMLYWGAGLWYWILYVIFYPVRLIRAGRWKRKGRKGK